MTSGSDVVGILTLLEKLLDARLRLCWSQQWARFFTTPDNPVIRVVVEEHHLVFPQATVRFENLVRKGRNAGIVVVPSGDDWSLSAFGGSDVLRDWCLTIRAVTGVAGS